MFQQIVVVDPTGLQGWALNQLQAYSVQPIRSYETQPDSEEEAGRRIADADCVFVSWSTELTAEVLSYAKSLRYIGMCCSLYDPASANVDIAYAERNGISVKGVRDYGDEGVVEFIMAELIRLMKGIGPLQWRAEQVELKGRKVGIIGMGTTGQMLADRLQAFGAELAYFSRSRKVELEAKGIAYLPLPQLLTDSEIISLHLPKHTYLLQQEEFAAFGKGKILINTSLGLTFDKSAFADWIAHLGNYAIFDGDGIGGCKAEFDQLTNVISTEVVAGWTQEAKERLSQKVLDNVRAFIFKDIGNSG